MVYVAINLEVEEIFSTRNTVYNTYHRHVDFAIDMANIHTKIEF